MSELEKGLSYFRGFKILSKKRVNIHLLNQRAYTCFFSLKEENGETKVEVEISAYAYIEISLLAVCIFLLFFSGLLLFHENVSLRPNKGGYSEFGLFFLILPLFYQFYLNWKRKMSGAEAIDKLMSQMDKDFNQN